MLAAITGTSRTASVRIVHLNRAAPGDRKQQRRKRSFAGACIENRQAARLSECGAIDEARAGLGPELSAGLRRATRSSEATQRCAQIFSTREFGSSSSAWQPVTLVQVLSEDPFAQRRKTMNTRAAFGVLASATAHRAKIFAPPRRIFERFCQCLRICARYHPSALARPHPFRGAATVGDDHRQAAGHRFRDRKRRAVFESWEHEQVGALIGGDRIAGSASEVESRRFALE